MASSSALLLCALLCAASSAALAAIIGGTATATNYETQALIEYRSNSSAIGTYAVLSNEDALTAFEKGFLPVVVTDHALKPGAHHTLPQLFTTYSFYVTSGLASTVKLTAKQIFQIYDGTITDWKQIPHNGGQTGTIVPIVRSDDSASTDAVTRWLQASYSRFPASGGGACDAADDDATRGACVWSPPEGGEAGLAPWIPANPNLVAYDNFFSVATVVNIGGEKGAAIGYLPSPLGATVFGLSEVAIKNPAGNYVVSTAAGALTNIEPAKLPSADGDWTGVSLINQPGSKTYPIAQFVYINALQKYVAPADGKDIVPFLNYLFDNRSQTLLSTFSFYPIPDWLRAQNLLAISNIIY